MKAMTNLYGKYNGWLHVYKIRDVGYIITWSLRWKICYQFNAMIIQRITSFLEWKRSLRICSSGLESSVFCSNVNKLRSSSNGVLLIFATIFKMSMASLFLPRESSHLGDSGKTFGLWFGKKMCAYNYIKFQLIFGIVKSTITFGVI